MNQIIASNGSLAVTNDLDFLWARQFDWHDNGSGYFYRLLTNRDHQYLHIEIVQRLNIDMTGYTVDHRDRNPRNNLRNNLRLATQSQQNVNRGLQSNNTSEVPGVSWDASRNKWMAFTRYRGKFKNLGRFTLKEDAVKCRNKMMKFYFGEFVPEDQ